MAHPIEYFGALVASAAILACASGGSQPHSQVPDQRVVVTSERGNIYRTQDASTAHTIRVSAPRSAAMAALSQVYTDIGIPIATIDADGGQIGNRHFRATGHQVAGKRLSSILECGLDPQSGARADIYEVTISVLSTLGADGDSATAVTTVVSGEARPHGVSADPVYCSTTGSLENAIGSRLKARLAGV
jgi:hypothetical protein